MPANGHGCDDVNPAVIAHQPSPGGPVGCEVGNSADHRQNGKNFATTTPVPTGTATLAADITATTHGHSNQGAKNQK